RQYGYLACLNVGHQPFGSRLEAPFVRRDAGNATGGRLSKVFMTLPWITWVCNSRRCATTRDASLFVFSDEWLGDRHRDAVAHTPSRQFVFRIAARRLVRRAYLHALRF